MEALKHNNKKIIKYAKLKQKKYRDEMNLFLIEGKHLIEEAKGNVKIVEVLSTKSGNDSSLISERAMKKISSLQTPLNLIAVCEKMKPTIQGTRILALDNVQDPGNAGTLIRTAKAFGWDAVLVKGVDIYNEKVIRATQGAIFQIDVINTNNLVDHFNGYQVVGAIVDTKAEEFSNKIFNDKKIILVLGNEGAGISDQIIKKLDHQVYIPMQFESLNISSAGAILMHFYQK